MIETLKSEIKKLEEIKALYVDLLNDGISVETAKAAIKDLNSKIEHLVVTEHEIITKMRENPTSTIIASVVDATNF